jgi:nucleoid DNA-binding protein
MDRKSVSLITKLFIEAARETLVEEGTVALPRLGQVTVTKVKRKKMFELASKHNPDVKYKRYVDAYFAVSFSMSPLLKKELKKNGKARSR